MARIKNLLQNHLVQHLGFWVLSFYVLYRLFAYEPGFHRTDVIYTSTFLALIMVQVYVNLRILIPRWLSTGRYWVYGLSVALLLAVGAQINGWLFGKWIDYIFPGYYFISYYEFWELAVFNASFWAITTLLKLSKGWFLLLETRHRLQQLQREKLTTELTALKAQINPHFLFNSLNNLYALALDQDSRTPEIILRLSEMMRYMLYESNSEQVPLEKELHYLQNYLEMQRLRLPPSSVIEWMTIGPIDKYSIAPLLLLPFVENAFKHGTKGKNQPAFVQISVEIAEEKLLFKVNNIKGETVDPTLPIEGGIGLSNVRRRLDLLYPQKHQLHIRDAEKDYSIELQIDLT